MKIGITVGDRRVETDMEGLERATRDARRGKPPAQAEPDPDRLACDGDNHVPNCEHFPEAHS